MSQFNPVVHRLKAYPLIFLIFIGLEVFAQQPQLAPTFVSPNTASLGMQAQKPVSLYTGTMSVQIPLYELKQGEITVPVSLSHAGTGVRVDEHPGWVGTNWSLQAGGVITRKVNGLPDEFKEKNEQGTAVKIVDLGFAYQYNQINQNNWYSPASIDNLWHSNSGPNQYISKYTFDMEPDEFLFNFNGISGKFYIGPDGTPRAQSNMGGLKIELVLSGFIPQYDVNYLGRNLSFTLKNQYGAILIDSYYSTTILTGFIITAEDGTKYKFGYTSGNYNDWGTLDNVEFSKDILAQIDLGEQWDAWYLTEIESASQKDKVVFEYAKGDYIASFRQTAAFELPQNSSTPVGLSAGDSPTGMVPGNNYNKDFQGRLIRPTYLKYIKSKSEVIEFTTAPTVEKKFPYKKIAKSLQNTILVTFDPNLSSQSEKTKYPRGAIIADQINYGNNPPDNIQVLNGDYVDFDKLKWYKLSEVSVKSADPQQQDITKKFVFGYNDDPNQRLQLTSLKETNTTGTEKPPYTFKYNYDSGNLPDYFSNKSDHWGYYNGQNQAWGYFDSEDPSSLGYNIPDWNLILNYKATRDPNIYLIQTGSLNEMTSPLGEITKFEYECNQYDAMQVSDGASKPCKVEPRFGYGPGLRITKIRTTDPVSGKEIIKEYSYSNGIIGGDVQYYWPDYRTTGLVYVSVNGTPPPGINSEVRKRFVSESLLPLSSNGGGGYLGYSKVTEKIIGNGYTEYNYTNFDTNPDESYLATINANEPYYTSYGSKDMQRGKLLSKTTYDERSNFLYGITNKYVATPPGNVIYFPAISLNRTQIPSTNGSLAATYSGASYRIFMDSYDLEGTFETTAVPNTPYFTSMVTYTQYTYTPYTYAFTTFIPYKHITSKSVINSKGEILTTQYTYSDDASLISSAPYSTMYQKHIFSPLVQETLIKGPIHVKSTKTNFYDWGNDVIKPISIATKYGNSVNYTNDLVFEFNSSTGDIISSAKEFGTKTIYVYSYAGQYPIAKIENATYAAVEAALGGSIAVNDFHDRLNPTVTDVNSFLSILRTHPSLKDAFVTTYTYKPPAGMTSVTDPKGQTTYYEYDSFNRLTNIKDQNGNILKHTDYHYQNQ